MNIHRRLSMPPEIVGLIFENLATSRSDLYSLAMTSKLFNMEATRLLYASMKLESGTNHFKFLAIIQKKPELAALVRTYHSPLSIHSQRRPFWHLLRRCLPLMTGLKELAYRKLWAEPQDVFPVFKAGGPRPFLLERFMWSARRNNLFSRVEVKEVQRFFEGQPNLKSIQWTGCPLARPIPIDVLPNLEVLESDDLYTFQMLLSSGRPQVTEIYWRRCHLKDIMDLGRCSIADALYTQMTSNLRGLSLTNCAWPLFLGAGLEVTLMKGLQRLEVLEICGTYQFSLILPIPRMFPNLKRLCLYNRGDGGSRNGGTGPDAWSLTLFRTCPSLIFLDVWDPSSEENYSRWVNIAVDDGPKDVNIPYEQSLYLPSLE